VQQSQAKLSSAVVHAITLMPAIAITLSCSALIVCQTPPTDLRLAQRARHVVTPIMILGCCGIWGICVHQHMGTSVQLASSLYIPHVQSFWARHCLLVLRPGAQSQSSGKLSCFSITATLETVQKQQSQSWTCHVTVSMGKKRKEKTTPFSVNLLRSPVLHSRSAKPLSSQSPLT
jgi:hypothetical protein